MNNNLRGLRSFTNEYLWECYHNLFIHGGSYAEYAKIYNELKRREKLNLR
jgi:hypothetical protein